MIYGKLNIEKFKYELLKNIEFMSLNKTFQNILLIFVFIYLIMSPFVHELGDNTRYDFVLKARAKISGKNFKNGFSFTPLILSNNSLTDDFYQFTTKLNFPIFTSSNPTLNLSILSTIRLIL